MDGADTEAPHFFISRTRADAEAAKEVGRVLEADGWRVLIQDRDFTNKNFLDQMDKGLATGARVIAILSAGYLASDHCEAEWFGALAGDPLNRKGRLIVLRVGHCAPRGLLRTIAYWDLVPWHDNAAMRAHTVRVAVMPDAARTLAAKEGVHWHPPRALLHDQIKPTDAFTGRMGELLTLDNQLWHRKAKAAAIVETAGLPGASRRSAAVTGLGGIGKTTIARQYGWEAQGDYAGVWWLHAEKGTAGGWTGITEGLAALGANYRPELARAEPEVAATETRRMLERGYFDKPWLLIFDNVDDPKVLDHWTPAHGAHVVATSRLGTLGRGFATVDIKAWAMPDAARYLLASSERDDLGEADAQRIAEALGGLPLALSHASAYLRTTTTATADSYLAALSHHMNEAPEDAAYDKAVFATFAAQMEQAERVFAGSSDVLRLAAFYGPDEVPEELFQQTAEYYPPALRAIVADRLKLERALGALDRLSLIDFSPASRTFSMHRVVQAAARDGLRADREAWAEQALAVLFAAFPEATQDNWPQRGRLAAHVPALAGNLDAGAQGRELGWLFVEVGDYQQERGSLAAAADAFNASLAIADRLAKADPGNAGWQRDLSVSHNKIGDVLRAQGNLPAALDAFNASLAIADRLAKADPGNAGWQADLAASHGKLGQLHEQRGDKAEALRLFRAGRAIVAPLAERSGHQLWIAYLKSFDQDIATLEKE